ncbi:MAG TPA: hypothetical protein VNP04_20295 [Alphaproteobacteria bacterium]|nr:hypothetical protein [Alphaproteobacteria bacterium]
MQRHEVYEMLVRLARRSARAGRRCCVFLTAAAAPLACIQTMYGQRWRRAMLTGVSVVLLAVGLALSAAEKKSPVDSSAEGEAMAEPEAAPSQLDLDALEQRLRETDAIGFFTKLALASQINSLLDTFRDFHNGEGTVTRDELWERYYLLLFKVVTLLQDGDPDLAQEIYAAREGLWELLLDPKTFDKS